MNKPAENVEKNSKHHQLWRDIAVCLFRVFFVFPLTGYILACIALTISVVPFEGFTYITSWYTHEAVPFGIGIGFIFSLPVVWSLRRQSYANILKYMGTGTICGALFGIIGGPGLAFLVGMLGYWIGYFLCLGELLERQKQQSPHIQPHTETHETSPS